jgi:hypothetical protein
VVQRFSAVNMPFDEKDTRIKAEVNKQAPPERGAGEA